MEATCNTRLFHDAVVELVARVAVVNPSQFKVISQSLKKTDKNDAELLALYLEKGLLPEVRTKEQNQRKISHLAQTRDLLVKQRSALKAKLSNLLAGEGINLKKETLSSKKALDRVLTLALSRIVSAEARVLIAQIRSLTRSIAALEELIKKESPKLAGHESLMSIEGFGPVGAAVLLSAIGRIEDFSDPGKLAAYLGLVPRVQNSNEVEHSGGHHQAGQQTYPHHADAVRSGGQADTVHTCSGSINVFNADAVAARPTSPWRLSFWESSITPSKITGLRGLP